MASQWNKSSDFATKTVSDWVAAALNDMVGGVESGACTPDFRSMINDALGVAFKDASEVLGGMPSGKKFNANKLPTACLPEVINFINEETKCAACCACG